MSVVFISHVLILNINSDIKYLSWSFPNLFILEHYSVLHGDPIRTHHILSKIRNFGRQFYHDRECNTMYAKACYIAVWFTLWISTEFSFLHSTDIEETRSLSFTSAQDAHQHGSCIATLATVLQEGAFFVMIFKRSVLILVDWWHLSYWSTSNILTYFLTLLPHWLLCIVYFI